MKKIWMLLLLITLAFVSVEPADSVVIVGGGPAGLATAIEARQANVSVTIVEKRNSYERVQRLFLLDHSLQLLERWGVEIPELSKIEVDGDYIGIVRIAALENALLKRAQELGVNVIQDEFIDVSPNERVIILKEAGEMPYDILVAADGVHSHLRKTLGIELHLINQGKAGAALIPAADDASSAVDISPDIQHGNSFIKKFYFPGIHLLFIQRPYSATQDDFITLCNASGWESLAKQIAEGRTKLMLDVDVYLQRAKSFSLKERNALLVGDAAGAGTFLSGLGANYAFKTAEIVGHFFTSHDFETFEAEISEATDFLIEGNSAYF